MGVISEGEKLEGNIKGSCGVGVLSEGTLLEYLIYSTICTLYHNFLILTTSHRTLPSSNYNFVHWDTHWQLHISATSAALWLLLHFNGNSDLLFAPGISWCKQSSTDPSTPHTSNVNGMNRSRWGSLKLIWIPPRTAGWYGKSWRVNDKKNKKKLIRLQYSVKNK